MTSGASNEQMRWTEEALTPTALAMAALVQWVASCGGSSIVSSTTRSAMEGASFGMRDGRVLSRGEALLPAPDAGLGFARLALNRVRADAFGAQQNDLRPPHVLLRRVAVFRQPRASDQDQQG
jgi:hypothetical protein